jgi:hypothetical protein
MSRLVRSRSRNTVVSGDYISVYSTGDQPPQTVTRTYTSSIIDKVGRPVVPSSLTSGQYTQMDLKYNGRIFKATGTARGVEFKNYFPQFAGNSVDLTAPAIPAGWELTAVARSNPSRPVLYPPEVVQDFVDLPKMIRNLYSLLTHPKTILSPKGLSNHYLALQFGWLPLIEDLQKLSNLQQYVNRRAQMVQQLYAGKKGLRRRVKFSTDHKNFSVLYQWNFDWGNLKLPVDVLVRRDVWATVRWKPTGPMPPSLLSEDGLAFYRRVVLGLTPEGMVAGLWKVIPWTWLIGWFTNLGDVLLVHSSTIPAAYTEACLMRKTVCVCTPQTTIVTGSPSENSVTQSGSQAWASRLRNVGSGNLLPSVNMPFLDMFRLSIVGALAIQRIRKTRF